jgi:TP901 family phage tail tape measure protein
MATGDVDFGRVGDDLRRAAASFALLTSSATAFGFALNSFREFQKELTLTNAIAGGTTDTFNRMAAAARQFSLSTTTSALEAVSALRNLAQAGFTAEQSIAGMTGVLLLAQATMADVAVASDLIASNIRAFGLEVTDTYRVANVLTASITASLASIDKLAYAFRQVAPVARLAGLSIEETTAALSVLFNVGLRGEQAGTALRNIIIRLVRPLGEAGTLLREAGIATRTATGEFRNLADILRDIAQSDLNDAQLARIFETEALAGVKAFIAALEDVGVTGEDAYERLLNAVTGTDKALELAVANLSTFDGQLKLFQNRLTDIAKQFGAVLAPLVLKFVDQVNNLLDAYQNLDQGTKDMIVLFGQLGVGLVAITAAAGALQLAYRALIGTGLSASMGGLIKVFNLAVLAFQGVGAALGAVALQFGVANSAALLFARSIRAIPFAALGYGAGLALVELTRLALGIEDVRDGAERLSNIVATSFGAEDVRQATADADAVADRLIGRGTAEEVRRRVDNVRTELDVLRGMGASALDVFSFTGRRAGSNEADKNLAQGAMDALNNEFENFEEMRAEYLELKRATDAAIQDANDGNFVMRLLGNNPGARAEDQQNAINRFFADYSAEERGAFAAAIKRMEELEEAVRVADENVAVLAEARQQALVDYVTGLQQGLIEPNEEYALALAALQDRWKETGDLPTQFIEELGDRIANSDASEQEAVRAIFEELLLQAGFSAERTTALLRVAEDQKNFELLNALSGLADSQARQAEELRIRVLEQELGRTENLAEGIRLANEAGLAQLELDLEDISKDLAVKFGEILVDFNIDTREGIDVFFEEALKGTGIDFARNPSLGEVVDGSALIKAINDQINASTSVDEAQEIIDREQAKYKQVFEAYVVALVAAGNITAEQEAELRRSFAAASDRISNAALLGLGDVGDSIEAQRQAELRRADELRRENERLRREQEQALKEQQRLAERARAEARAVEDAFLQLARTSDEVRRSYLETLRGVSLTSRIEDTFDLDLQSIVAGYDQQIRELQREFEDLAREFAGDPIKLRELATEYDALINQIEALKQAEIDAADSFTAQMERRSAALELFRRDLTDVAFEANDTFTSVGAGIARAFAEYQKELVGIIDITENATSGLIDTLSTGIGDFIYDTENMWDNFKKNMLDISRQIFEGFTKALVQQTISSATGGGGSIFGNALQPSRRGGEGLPGMGVGGLLGRLFPGLSSAFGGQQAQNELLDPLQNTLTEVSVVTEQVYRDALTRTEAVLTNFTNGLATAFNTTVNALGGNIPTGSGTQGTADFLGGAMNSATGAVNSIVPGLGAAIQSVELFSQRSVEHLTGVDSRLVEILALAKQMSGIDFEITDGLRTVEEQRELVARGASQTMNSRHLTGMAADVVIMNADGSANWSPEAYTELAGYVEQAAGQLGYQDQLTWGGEWQSFFDGPHFQLDGEFGMAFQNSGQQLMQTAATALQEGIAGEQQIFQALMERGLSAPVAAGAVGNFIQESGLDPNALGDNGTSFGLAQWHASRMQDYQQFATEAGAAFGDIGTQLDFFVHELQTTEAGVARALEGVTDASEAADIIARQYERPDPAHANYARRMSEADRIYAQYGGGMQTTLPYNGQLTGDPNQYLSPLMGGSTQPAVGGVGQDLLGGGVPGLDQAVQSITSAVNDFGTNLANVFNQFIQSMQAMAQQVASGAGVTYSPVTAVGGLGSIGGLGGGMGGLFGFLGNLFDDGGYTGNIDPDEIAGVVHGGEFVVKKKQTDRWRPLLEMINNGMMPGYSDGGYVGGGSFSGSMVNSNNSQGDSINLRVTYVMGGGNSPNGFRRSASQHAKMLARQLDKAKRNT